MEIMVDAILAVTKIDVYSKFCVDRLSKVEDGFHEVLSILLIHCQMQRRSDVLLENTNALPRLLTRT